MPAKRGRQITTFGGFLASPFDVGSSFKGGILKRAYIKFELSMPSCQTWMETPAGELVLEAPNVALTAYSPATRFAVQTPKVSITEES